MQAIEFDISWNVWGLRLQNLSIEIMSSQKRRIVLRLLYSDQSNLLSANILLKVGSGQLVFRSR